MFQINRQTAFPCIRFPYPLLAHFFGLLTFSIRSPTRSRRKLSRPYLAHLGVGLSLDSARRPWLAVAQRRCPLPRRQGKSHRGRLQVLLSRDSDGRFRGRTPLAAHRSFLPARFLLAVAPLAPTKTLRLGVLPQPVAAPHRAVPITGRAPARVLIRKRDRPGVDLPASSQCC